LWTLEPGAVVGSAAAAGAPRPDEFGRVSGVTLGPEGRLYVADEINDEIRVFDREGEHLASWGRSGEGPGEFGAIRNLAWVGDTLLALDYMVGRVAEFDRDGSWLGQRPAPGRVTGSPTVIRLYQLGPDEVVQWTLEATGSEMQQGWVRHTASGAQPTIPQPPLSPPENATIVCDHPSGSIHFFPRPFGGRLLVHPAAGGGTWIGWSADYRIARVDADGDTLQVVERAWAPLPVGDDEWRAATEDYRAFRESEPGASCRPRDFERTTNKPAFQTLMVDIAGRLWVEALTPEGTEWEVFDADGRLIARVPSFGHDPTTVPWLGVDEVAWVSADSLGVQRVHRARIARP
ncbi:MAG: 6-bladed beta-propeller, partial [Phycisphaerales bacterium JB038]